VEAVRPATVDDLPELERLAALARDELGGERGGPMWQLLHGRPEPLPATLAADLAEVAAGTGIVLLGTVDGAPGGYAAAHRDTLGDGTSLAVVSDVYVEPGFRGIGLGAALMDELLAWAEAHGCRGIDALALPGMRHSKNFFERYGLTARAILVHRDLR
jgi:GNAT superfamily N-acetyltransferase